MQEGILSEKDHNDCDAFLGRVLDAYKSGKISRGSAVESIVHFVAAVDKRNATEIKSWLNENNANFIFGGQ